MYIVIVDGINGMYDNVYCGLTLFKMLTVQYY